MRVSEVHMRLKTGPTAKFLAKSGRNLRIESSLLGTAEGYAMEGGAKSPWMLGYA